MKLLQIVFFLLILVIFLPLLGITVFFNHEPTFQKISNFLLEPISIEIREIENINLSLSDYSLSFENIYLHYEGNIAHLHQATLALGNINEKRIYHEVNIQQLSIYLNGMTSLEKNQTQTVNFLDYLPEKIIKDYSGVDVSVERLTIHHTSYLKQPLVLNNVGLLNQTNSLTLKSSPTYQNHQAGVNIQLNTDNRITINFHLSENDFLNMSLSAAPNDKQNELLINNKISLVLSNEFQKFLSTYWTYSDKIHSIQSKIDFSGEQKIDSSINNIESLYPMFMTGNFKSSIQANLAFNNLAIETVAINLKAEAISNYKSDTEKSSAITFLEKNVIEIKPNKKHKVFKQNKNFEFLSQKPIFISFKPNTQIKTQTEHFNLGQGLSLTWANPKDPAFLQVDIDTFTGSYDSFTNFNSRLDYRFNGRWNRKLASQHVSSIQLNRINSQFLINASLKDEELRSEVNFNLEQNNRALTGNYYFQLGKLQSNNKKLNTFISYWVEDLNFLSGSMDIRGTLHSSISANNQLAPVHYQFDMNVKNMAADYDGFIFSNINSTAFFSGVDQSIINKNDFTIHINKIDAGVDINNFSINAQSTMQLDGDSTIRFSNMTADTLGGKIFTDNFIVYLPYSETNTKQKYHAEFLVDLLDMQLSQVLKLADNPEIQGKGLLYGKLPVFVDEKSTLIKSGWIKNKNKGTLRYVPNIESKAMLKQNPQMKLLLDVLGHLNYDQLTGDIELDDSGLMTIQGHLQGVNPDFKKGYPIIFNPRIELDLQDMITSLQISEDISDKVSNRIQEKHLD